RDSKCPTTSVSKMRMRPFSWLIYLLFPAVCLSTSCEMLKKSHYDYSTLLKKGAASDLKICTGKNACCTKQIEDEILESSEKNFKSQLEDKLLVLRHMINSHLNGFRTFFYNSLNACHEHLDTLFDRTYGAFYQSNSQIFDTFFNRLRAFSSPFSDAKVSQITGQLFEEMFVIMFQLMNPLHTVSASQRRCMIEGMEEIAPFGDVPKKITVHMEKSLTFWKHFVTGLDKVHNIFDGFMNVSISNECRVNLAKMWDCSLCSGEPQSKPCPGLCTNVMKGCLADWAEVDQQWNAVVEALLKMAARLKDPQNLYQALQPLPVQLSEAVMEMQERSVTVSNKVIARCYTIDDVIREPRHLDSLTRFRARRNQRDLALRSIAERAENYGKVLTSLMNSFADRLSVLRGWFTGLPKAFCSDSGLVAPDGEKCWNGNQSASYTKELAGDGLAGQGKIPEYQAARILPYRGVFIDERLRLGMLAFRLQNALHGHNYTNYQIEGSGDSDDDEDYDEGSGSLSIVSLHTTESSENTSDVLPHTSFGSRQLVPVAPLIVVLLYLTRRFTY
ncbi:hypothetical protein V3C99_007017, partial [Haemonchus contortus]